MMSHIPLKKKVIDKGFIDFDFFIMTSLNSFFAARTNPAHKARNRCHPSRNNDIAGHGS